MSEKPQGFKKKWENYWYHYTPQTIVAALVAILLITFVKDVFTNTTYDLTMGFISKQQFAYDLFELDKQQIAGPLDDVDGDNEKNITIDIMSVSPTIKNVDDMNMQEKIMLSFAVGDTRLYILEEEYAVDYAEMFYPLDDELSASQLEDAVKFQGKAVAASLKNSALIKKWGLRGDELYIAVVDVVPAHENIKYIDKLFENSVNAMHYILEQR